MKVKLKQTLARLLKNASYNPGDTLTWSDWVGGGFITSGAADVFFGLPLQKPINGTVQIQSALYIVRQNGKYILGSASSYTDGTSKTTEYFRSDSMIGFRYHQSSALTNATNNDAIGIQVKVTLKVV